MTIPRFAAAEGRKLLEGRTVPENAEAWTAEAKRRRQALVDNVLGGFPKRTSVEGLKPLSEGQQRAEPSKFQTEPGLTLTARRRLHRTKNKPADVAILLDLDGADKAPPVRWRRRCGGRLECRHAGSAGNREACPAGRRPSAGLRITTRPNGRCGSADRCWASGPGTSRRLLDDLDGRGQGAAEARGRDRQRARPASWL